MGRLLTPLTTTLTCATATDALVNYSMYVPQRPSKVPIAPMGKCLVDMSIRFSSLMMWVLPRCTSLEYVPSAPETSKVPIAPMGIPADLPNRLSSFNSDRYLVLSGLCTCLPHLQTSHRPDGKMADMPKSTLIFRFGLIFGSIRDMYVPATPANFPSPDGRNG